MTILRIMGNAHAGSSAYERRHGGRVESSGTAMVHGTFGVRGRIIDLAVGGLSVLVESTTATPDVGTHVRIDVRLDGRGRWLHLIGSIVRVDVHGAANALVIQLLVVPPDFEDLVQDELLAAVECAHQPHVLLVDPERERRDVVAAAFRASGCHVIETSSPLEAIIEIDQSRLHPWAVVIADTEIASRADELRRFVDETYPSIPVIVIGERGGIRGRSCLSVDRIPDLALQIHDLVSTHDHAGGLV